MSLLIAGANPIHARVLRRVVAERRRLAEARPALVAEMAGAAAERPTAPLWRLQSAIGGAVAGVQSAADVPAAVARVAALAIAWAEALEPGEGGEG